MLCDLICTFLKGYIIVFVDPSKPRVSTQPQLTGLPQAYWMLMCWLLYACVGDDPSKPMVSTQPQLKVLPQTHWISMCWWMVMVVV